MDRGVLIGSRWGWLLAGVISSLRFGAMDFHSLVYAKLPVIENSMRSLRSLAPTDHCLLGLRMFGLQLRTAVADMLSTSPC